MSFESLFASPEVIKTSVVEANDTWDLKKESFPDKKWEDDITPLSETENYKWEEEHDKSPDMTDYVDRSLEHDINSYETLKNDQILKKEQLENKTSDLSNKIQETQNNIENLELKSDILETLENTLNDIVVYLNSIGIKIEKFDFSKIDELKTDIDNEKSNLTKLDNQSKEFQSKINTAEQNIDSLNDNINNIEQKKKYFDENLRSKYDNFDEYAKEKNLTPADIDAINESKMELVEKLSEANVDKLSQKQFIEEMDQYVISTIEDLKEEVEDFDPDYKAVVKSASISSGIGAGVGAATGGPFGALVGATLNGTMGVVGELSAQYLKHRGASDTEALLVQTGVEVIGGAGLIKLGSKLGVHGGKFLIKNIDKVDDVAKVSSKLDKTDDVIKSANKLDNVDDTIKTSSKIDNVEDITKNSSKYELNNFLPKENGKWLGEKGNSIWSPDLDFIPKKPPGNKLSFGEILEKYDQKGIKFKKGEVDFSPFSEGTVKIKDFSLERALNFTQADELLAKKWTQVNKGGRSWSPQDIFEYRKEHNLSWHERKDMKTLDLVSQEIHGNVPHSGGISKLKELQNKTA